MWFIITSYTMISPFFVCSIPYLDYQLEMNSKLNSTQLTFSRKIKIWMIMTPLIIPYLIVLDLIYLINSMLIFPLIFIISKVTCSKIDIN